jgi:hypothetical protein
LVKKFNSNLTIYNDAEDYISYASLLQETKNYFKPQNSH